MDVPVPVSTVPAFIVEEIPPIDEVTLIVEIQRGSLLLDIRRRVVELQLNRSAHETVARIGEILFGQVDVLRVDEGLQHDFKGSNQSLSFLLDRDGIEFNFQPVLRHQHRRQLEIEFLRLLSASNETRLAIAYGNVVRPKMNA